MEPSDECPVPEPDTPKHHNLATFVLWLFGVIIPAATLVIEAAWGMSADIYFDPIPTVAHMGLVALVPTVNGVCLWRLRTLWRLRPRQQQRLDRLHLAVAFSMGMSAIYALLFLPIAPIALPGIIFFGIGLLPLAPALSFIASAMLWCRISRMARADTAEQAGFGKRLLVGLLSAAAVLMVLEAPMTAGQVATRMAAAETEVMQSSGVDLLRLLGDETAKETACDGRRVFYPGLISPLLSVTTSASPQQRAKAYYRAMGERCFEERQDDIPHRPHVDAPVSLVDSTFDGQYRPDQAAAELDWTFAVNNASDVQQEARMLVQLPHGAVVTDVTLWMEGKPEKAEVDERAKVTRAYERTVAKARDPILVRSAGPDRIEVRCFPVPPGGEMRAKLTFAVPARNGDGATVEYGLPSIMARDFHVATRHRVHLDSPVRAFLRVYSRVTEGDSTRTPALSKDVSDRKLAATSLGAYTSAPTLESASSWRGKAPEHLIWVIDGSAGMAAHTSRLVTAMDSAPNAVSHSLIFAGDRVETVMRGQRAAPAKERLASEIENYDFAGGRDNAAALSRAWQMAGDGEDAAIVWIHAAQTQTLEDPHDLERAISEADVKPTIYELQVDTGVDRILEAIEPTGIVAAVPRDNHTLDGALLEWLCAWGEQPRDAGQPQGAALEGLEVYRRVIEKLRAGQRKSALELANRHRLVTPVSAAVALEPGQDLDVMGAPTAGNRTPGAAPSSTGWPSFSSAPEPEVWAMLLLLAVGMLVGLRRRVAA